MVKVIISQSAQKEYAKLPNVIQVRIAGIFERLAEWPNVSGAKPLRGNLKNHYRIRTGDYRVIFQVIDDVVIIKIAHRKDVYEG